MRGLHPGVAVLLATMLGAISGCSQPPSTPSPPAVSSPSPTFTGQIHETAPTQAVLIGGAQITIAGGPLDGVSATSDASGAFSMPAVKSGGLNLVVSKQGYERRTVTVPDATASARVDVGLAPQYALVTEVLEGDLTAACPSSRPAPTASLLFSPHHAGPLKITEGSLPAIGFEPSFVVLYQENERVWYSSCPVGCRGMTPPPEVVPAKPYRMTVGLSDCFNPEKQTGRYRVVFTHPN